MKEKSQIIKLQKSFIADYITLTNDYIKTIEKTHIETILLSGSVARGDFFPGELGGMVDLTIFKKQNDACDAEGIFGKNECPEMPYHCVNWNNIWFQILFCDFLDKENFQLIDEEKKYSLLESRILWESNNYFKNELPKIKEYKDVEVKQKVNDGLKYIKYLLSDYKKERWLKREAFLQLHENLNSAINIAIKCLFYINGEYSPARDRILYYSFSLKKIPEDYYNLILDLKKQEIDSEADFNRREKLFVNEFIDFIQKNI